MASVQLQSLSKRFGTVIAVDNVDLSICDGEFMVLLGPSGCGKTTTLRLIAGLEATSSGRILIRDRDVTHVRPGQRGCAMVFQDYALYPHMSVRENLSFALRNLRHPRAEIEERVTQVAGLLQIGDLLDRKPRQLSGGQRQRVALGRAIVRRPDVYLFDEPLSNLDAKLRVAMRVELSDLHRRLGTTSAYVTHDQVEAMTLGTRICVMNGGVLQQVGSGDELYNQPANVFVAGFIGSPSMNLLHARLMQAEGLCVVVDDVRLSLPPAYHEKYAAYVGQEVVFGLRPEDIQSATGRARTGNWAAVRVTPRLVEELGKEALVYFKLGAQPVVASVDPGILSPSQEAVDLVCNMDKMHLFDKTAGHVIR